MPPARPEDLRQSCTRICRDTRVTADEIVLYHNQPGSAGIIFVGRKRRRSPGREPAGMTVTLAAGVAHDVMSPVALRRPGCEMEAG